MIEEIIYTDFVPVQMNENKFIQFIVDKVQNEPYYQYQKFESEYLAEKQLRITTALYNLNKFLKSMEIINPNYVKKTIQYLFTKFDNLLEFISKNINIFLQYVDRKYMTLIFNTVELSKIVNVVFMKNIRENYPEEIDSSLSSRTRPLSVDEWEKEMGPFRKKKNDNKIELNNTFC